MYKAEYLSVQVETGANCGSVALMLATVYFLKRVAKQLNTGINKDDMALNKFVVGYHILMLLAQTVAKSLSAYFE